MINKILTKTQFIILFHFKYLMGKNKKKANVDEAKEALISDKKAGELMDLASSDDKDIEQTNRHSLERSKVSYSKRAESENGSVKDKLIN